MSGFVWTLRMIADDDDDGDSVDGTGTFFVFAGKILIT